MAFQKGIIPWNKGKKGLQKNANTDGLKLGRGLYKGQVRKYNYANIHYWIRKKRGTSSWCEHCGRTDGHFEWANIDHMYRQEASEYISLCKKCHTKYDYENGLSNKGSRGGSIPNRTKEVSCLLI